MVLKIYHLPIGQPSRALVAFLKLNNIEYEDIIVDATKGAHHSPEYINKFPLAEIPAMDDDGYCLQGGQVIVAYLVSTRNLADHWYPADPKARAQVNHLIHLYHATIRPGRHHYYQNVVKPKFLGQEPDQAIIDYYAPIFENSLDYLEAHVLGESGFLSGSEMNIADLNIAMEL
jgi:glutathione S-transferase